MPFQRGILLQGKTFWVEEVRLVPPLQISHLFLPKCVNGQPLTGDKPNFLDQRIHLLFGIGFTDNMAATAGLADSHNGRHCWIGHSQKGCHCNHKMAAIVGLAQSQNGCHCNHKMAVIAITKWLPLQIQLEEKTKFVVLIKEQNLYSCVPT